MHKRYAHALLIGLAAALALTGESVAQQGPYITQYRAWCGSQGGRVVTGNDANDLGGLACVGATKPLSGGGGPSMPGGYNPAVTALGMVVQPMFNQIGQGLACMLFGGCENDVQQQREAAEAAAIATARLEAERQAALERERQRIKELNEAKAYVESRNRTGLSTAVAPRDLGLATTDPSKRDLLSGVQMTEAQRTACALGYLEAAASAAQLGRLEEAVAISADAQQVANRNATCTLASVPKIGRVIDANESAEVFRKAELLRKLFTVAHEAQKAETDLREKTEAAGSAKKEYEIARQRVQAIKTRPPAPAPAVVATAPPPSGDPELEAALKALEQSETALQTANDLVTESQKKVTTLKGQFKETNQQLGNTAVPVAAGRRG